MKIKKYTTKQKLAAAIEVIKDLQIYRCKLNNCTNIDGCKAVAPDYITQKLDAKSK